VKKIDDIEIAKLLVDVRKRGILDIAKNPVTVSQIAEEMNEKQSRLYYHVKKLEEAGLLELVETRQQGNLIEKYYKRTETVGRRMFELDETLLKEHHNEVMDEIMKLLQPGLKLLQSELKKGKPEKQVNLMVRLSELTGEEWELSHEKIMNALEQTDPVENHEDSSLPSLTEEELKRKSKYAYIMLSYRIEDANE
jgi:DNA-binding transcriptional ArsR family regulator